MGFIFFFDWEGDGETDHMGIDERVENGTVYTVESNSGGARSFSLPAYLQRVLVKRCVISCFSIYILLFFDKSLYFRP